VASRWGIAGLGRIAHEFAVALHVYGASIQAVAAGSLPRKKARSVVFADQFGVDQHHAYDSYEKLVQDPDVDIIYIATTNNLHHKVALLAISHGKHVLVEKPTAMNAREVEEMTEAAMKKGVFFASNYWNSAFPAVRFAREAVRQGKIGEIIQVTGDMGFQAVTNYQDRWLSAELGGGSLMDMGCYLLHFLVMMTNEQKGVNASAKISIDNAVGRLDPNTKVDVDTSYTAQYNGVVGRFGTSIIRASPFTVQIMGTQGMITIESPANCPTEASLVAFWDASRTSFMPYPCCVQPLAESRDFSEDLPPYPRQFFPQQYPRGTGFVYIIEAVTECLRAGCKELPDVPQSTALKIQQAVDAIRSKLHTDSNVLVGGNIRAQN